MNKDIEIRYNLLGLPRRVRQPYDHTYDIKYMYDAAGNKLRKTTKREQCVPQPCQAILWEKDYIGNFVYEQGELKMIYHPEGVIRPTPENAENETEYVYVYFIKDYLGNVRVVITEEDADTTKKFLATMEDTYAYFEKQNFDNLDSTREDLPSEYPLDGSVEFNERIARLSEASGTEMGPSMVLPVRRGDKVNLSTKYFYEEDAPGTTYDNTGLFVNEILMALASSGAGILRLSETQLINIATGDPQYANGVLDLLSNEFDTTDVSKPHSLSRYPETSGPIWYGCFMIII
jgi:hypothetical protein